MVHAVQDGGAARPARRWGAAAIVLAAFCAAAPAARGGHPDPAPTATPPAPSQPPPAPTPEPSPTAHGVAEPPPAVAWTELRYAAHKLFLSATTTIRAASVPAAELAVLLRPPEKGRPVAAPADGAVAVSLASELPFGRDERVTLWLDPASGAALGGEKTMLGGSAYHKFMRFTQAGLYTWRSSPRGERERSLPPEDWTNRSHYLTAPALGPPPGMPVADPYALLYLVSAARLDRKDGSLPLVLLSGDRYVEIAFAAGGLSYVRADFEESWPGGARRRNGDVLVRTVRGAARAVGAAASADDVDLGFLGMRGALTLFVEVGTGIPIAFSGRADYIGHLTVRLTRAVLATAPAATAAAASATPAAEPPPP
ncbi:MAG: hypothetical protein EPN53_07450 [Acidobacteria bacterium]|nr:MAG: hypothetical protein EPN53_07450 [Acidobacteriota bacterium]